GKIDRQTELFLQEKIDPSRVVVVRRDAVTADDQLLRDGLCVCYSHADPEIVKRAVDVGFAGQIVLGGGLSSPSHLIRSRAARLLESGVTEAQVHQMLGEPPRKLLPLG